MGKTRIIQITNHKDHTKSVNVNGTEVYRSGAVIEFDEMQSARLLCKAVALDYVKGDMATSIEYVREY